MNASVRELPVGSDFLALTHRWPARYPCLLESAASGSAQARYDILFVCQDGLGLRLDADGRVRDLRGADRGAKFLQALDVELRSVAKSPTLHGGARELPFRGGWMLYLGYELAAEIEPRLRLPATASALPTALALRCPAALIREHLSGRAYAVAESGYEYLLDGAVGDLAAAGKLELPAPLAHAVVEDPPAAFLAGVARILEYLNAGDVFQVNLSREWRAELAEGCAPAALYAALRRANPAPFAGLMQWQGNALISSSPERLVEVRGECVQTRPIAGTRPRLPNEDAAQRIGELRGHPKERAEHVMLIDLERNDLGRICVPGSVQVDELMSVESYAHVHHIVSNVSGRLRPGITPGQTIAALFPGGTITGCPKVRCMEIIAELEQVGRGPYTGALGYLNCDGDMDLNILIRTLSQSGDSVRLRAGAGIVADSIAERELDETRAKARGMLRALGA